MERNIGMEVEGRKSFAFLTKALRDFYFTGNVALIRSEIRLDTEGTSFDVTNAERPLQGQSPYMLNLQLEYDNPDSGTMIALLFNEYGRRITSAGATGQADQYEEPYRQVDLVCSQKLGAGFKLKMKGQNLMNYVRRETKDGQEVTSMRKGINLGFAISWSY